MTELGALRELVFVCRTAMFRPPAGAEADKVTVQVEDACAVNTVELHSNPVRVTAVCGWGASVSEKF